MNRLSLALVILLLAACQAPLHRPSSAPPSSAPQLADGVRNRFGEGLDELLSGDTTILQAIADDPRGGPWRERAAALLARQGELTSLDRAATTLRRQLEDCQKTSAALAGRNSALSHDLQELKRILLEEEMRNGLQVPARPAAE